MIFSESAKDIVHSAADQFGWKDAVLVCDDGETIRVHYDATDKTFVNKRCSDHTKFKTIAEVLQQHAGARRGDILDIAKIHGVSLRNVAKHGDEMIFV